MNLDRIKYIFNRLPFHSKLIFIGSLALFISCFLPWYSDIDSYNTGDVFLGVSGPTSFMGIAIMLCSAASFFLVLQRARGRYFPKLKLGDGLAHMVLSIESVLLLFLVNSVLYHPRFGVHITLKEPQFGMVTAGLSAVAYLAGSYLLYKEKNTAEDEFGRLEPLIKMDQTNETPALNMKTQMREHQEIEKEKRLAPVVRGAQLEGFTYRRDNVQDSIRKKVELHDEAKREKPQAWRMDL